MSEVNTSKFKVENTIEQLKAEEKTLRAALDTSLKRLGFQNINDLDTDQAWKTEKLDLEERHNNIQLSLNEFRKNVISKQQVKKLDINYYKNHAKQLCFEITGLKQHIKSKLEDLQKDEKLIQKELDNTEKLCKSKITNYSNKKNKPIPVLHNKEKSNQFTQDVDNFERFLLQTGGHTGGWGDEEHNVFLKVWQKYHSQILIFSINNDHNMIAVYMRKIHGEIMETLQDKSLEDVLLHIQWMLKYHNLKQLKKCAVENWRILQNANKFRKDLLNNNHDNDQEKCSNPKNDVLNSQIAKRKLENWHLLKHAIEKIESEKEAEKVIIKNEMDCKKNAERKIEREIILQWINAKRMDFEKEEEQNEYEEIKLKQKRSSMANKKIKEYRERDKIYITKRLEDKKLNIQIKSPNDTKNKNQMKSNTKGQYDKLTKTWLHKLSSKKEKSEEEKYIINGIENIPKLAIPRWRFGLAA